MTNFNNKICLSPFKEINCGSESIYDYVKDGHMVPDTVITYLKSTTPYLMCPGVYEHPFNKGKMIPGPYLCKDDNFYWEQNTWEYVAKHHVVLPQKFIDYVMSEEKKEE